MPFQHATPPTNRASLAWKFGVVLVAVILGLFVFSRKPAAPTEILASELKLRDGLLYRGDQSEPFEGFMIEKYSDAALKSRSQVRGGRLDGVSEGWHTNGLLQVREFFRGGTSHGLREKWFENGKKASESSIVDGKHDGVFRRWHENGVLAEEVTMRQGEPDGLSRAFYPSGFLKAQAMLQKGQVVERKSWEDGESNVSPPVASSK